MDAFAQFVNDSLLAYDNNEYTIAAFLDSSKAFHTIDHKVLLKKFQCNAIRGLALNLFKRYLTDIKQSVQFNNRSSSQRRVNCGLPHRSVLGLLRFLIYINDPPVSLDQRV